MLFDRYLLASKGFEHHLRAVPPGGWEAPTPCTEWDVRALVNHMTRGNLSYVGLLRGATREEFLAAPPPGAPRTTRQDRLLTRFGRDPRRAGSPAARPAR